MKPALSPSSKSQEAIVSVSALGGMGDGLSSLNDKPLFIQKAAEGDKLKINIIHETKEALRGEIIEIIEAGSSRITAPCPHFAACGGCSLQQLDKPSYQSLKQRMLQSALAHAGFGDVKGEVTFLPAASRRRVELKVIHGEGNLSFAYYASRSRDMVAIKECLILEPELQKSLAPLAQELSKWHAVKAIKTVSLTMADSGIDMVLECSSVVENTSTLSALADSLNIGRISLSTPGNKMMVVVSRSPITMRLGEYDISLPAGAFIQASNEGQKLLTKAVLSGVGKTKSVVDLFCGIGTYGFPLSKTTNVRSIENSSVMVRNLKTAITTHKLENKMTTQQRDLFIKPLQAKELGRYGAVVINPPRPGAKKQCEEIAKSPISKVVMISCNPASFARDAKILGKSGFTLTQASAIDQFVYSSHLEIIAVFER